jgi:hypothetical protein
LGQKDHSKRIQMAPVKENEEFVQSRDHPVDGAIGQTLRQSQTGDVTASSAVIWGQLHANVREA